MKMRLFLTFFYKTLNWIKITLRWEKLKVITMSKRKYREESIVNFMSCNYCDSACDVCERHMIPNVKKAEK